VSDTSGPVLLGVSLKMYMGFRQTVRWCEDVAAVAAAHPAVADGAAELFVLPSFPAIPTCHDVFAGTPIRVGAQHVAPEDRGAYTGEVGAPMLAEIGCTYAEVGHAERRQLFGEDLAMIVARSVAALRNGLTPVLCVGEEREIPSAHAARECLDDVRAVVDGAQAAGLAAPLVVAYEPQWAIGATEPASPEHITAVCALLGERLDAEPVAAGSRVIYGGSAGPGLLSRLGPAVDGLFLGRFAHDPAALEAVLDEVPTTRTVAP
jgi:triosephosphate isomerase (TIM)